MNCTRARQVMDACLDEELDSSTRLEVVEHLAQCPNCARAQAERAALGQRIRANVQRYTAPPELRARVAARVHSKSRSAPTVAPPTTRYITWLHAIALCSVFGITTGLIGYQLGRPPSDTRAYDDIVARHAASFRSSGLPTLDVASTDRHVVKPWLHGKVDFVPPVRNLASYGFELVGARLERGSGAQSVAVVYKVRNHYINVFVWRIGEDTAKEASAHPTRGFHVVDWKEHGLHHAAVSDIDARELTDFVALLRSSPGELR